MRPQPVPFPWERALASGVAVVGPVSVGVAWGHLGVGIVGSLGALTASLADIGGPYRHRAIRIPTVTAAAAAGFFLGSLVLGHPGWSVGAVVAAAFVSGLVTVLGNTASFASMQFVVYTVVASGIDLGAGPPWRGALVFLAGGAWGLALSMATGLGRVSAPERSAVATVYESVARLLEAVGTADVATARQRLTTALNGAYDTLTVARSRAGGRDKAFRRLVALLNEATPVVEATHVLIRDANPLPPAVLAAVQEIPDAIRRGTSAPAIPDGEGDSAAVVALLAALAPVSALLKVDDPGDPSSVVTRSGTGERLMAAWDSVRAGPVTLLAIVRLCLCMAVAELVMHLLPLQRPYWVALTVAVSLKPDFGSTFARAAQRALGTIVGVAIGSVLVAFVPFGPWILVAMAVSAALIPVGAARNYGLYATVLTPVIVFLIDLGHHGDQQLIVFRLIDTVLGSAIVIVAGFLPWPDSWRSGGRIAEEFAAAADDVLAYLRVALEEQTPNRPVARRRTYRRLSDLRTVFQQALAEPPPVSTRVTTWWPAIVALEQLTDAVTALVVQTEHGGAHPSREGVDVVLGVMQDLATTARTQQPPRPLPPPPDDDVLHDVVAELQVVHGVLSGRPELTGKLTGRG